MSKKIDWNLWEDTDEFGNFPQLDKGPQVVGIIDVEDVVEKQYLKIKVDIIEGEFKDTFRDQYKRFGEYPNQGIIYRSYKPSAYPFLKAFVTALEKSNDGYNFRNTGGDFTTFRGKKLVANFGYEEIPYPDDNGNPKVVLKISEVRSTQALANGDVKVIDKVKKLNDYELELFKEKNAPLITDARSQEIIEADPLIDDDLPF